MMMVMVVMWGFGSNVVKVLDTESEIDYTEIRRQVCLDISLSLSWNCFGKRVGKRERGKVTYLERKLISQETS
jgi:hypothetical protein